LEVLGDDRVDYFHLHRHRSTARLGRLFCWLLSPLLWYLTTLLPVSHQSVPRLLLVMSGVLISIAVLALAIRWRRCQFVDYLGLIRPQRKEVLSAVLILVPLIILSDLISHLSGRDTVTPQQIEVYKYMRDAGVLSLWMFYAVLLAPVCEELIFRGFLWRGLVASSAGIRSVSIITSASWALIHAQYEMFFILQIFILGLFLAWIRWRSGSTILTITLHALNNIWAVAEVAFIVERVA
jgi:membrane protease YdiL (CAAX protease family)